MTENVTDLLDKARALEEQLRADDAAMTRAPWQVGPYYRRDGMGHGDFVHDVTAGELTVAELVHHATAAGIARTRNALPAIADTLRDLRVEVERLTRECDRHENVGKALAGSHVTVKSERDAALARVKELSAGVAAMRPVVEAALSWRAESWVTDSEGDVALSAAVDAYRLGNP